MTLELRVGAANLHSGRMNDMDGAKGSLGRSLFRRYRLALLGVTSVVFSVVGTAIYIVPSQAQEPVATNEVGENDAQHERSLSSDSRAAKRAKQANSGRTPYLIYQPGGPRPSVQAPTESSVVVKKGTSAPPADKATKRPGYIVYQRKSNAPASTAPVSGPTTEVVADGKATIEAGVQASKNGSTQNNAKVYHGLVKSAAKTAGTAQDQSNRVIKGRGPSGAPSNADELSKLAAQELTRVRSMRTAAAEKAATDALVKSASEELEQIKAMRTAALDRARTEQAAKVVTPPQSATNRAKVIELGPGPESAATPVTVAGTAPPAVQQPTLAPATPAMLPATVPPAASESPTLSLVPPAAETIAARSPEAAPVTAPTPIPLEVTESLSRPTVVAEPAMKPPVTLAQPATSALTIVAEENVLPTQTPVAPVAPSPAPVVVEANSAPVPSTPAPTPSYGDMRPPQIAATPSPSSVQMPNPVALPAEPTTVAAVPSPAPAPVSVAMPTAPSFGSVETTPSPRPAEPATTVAATPAMSLETAPAQPAGNPAEAMPVPAIPEAPTRLAESPIPVPAIPLETTPTEPTVAANAANPAAPAEASMTPPTASPEPALLAGNASTPATAPSTNVGQVIPASLPKEPPYARDVVRLAAAFQEGAMPLTPAAKKKIDDLIESDPGEEIALQIRARRSKILRTKRPLIRTVISDPNLIEVVQFGPREFAIIGKGEGTTNLTLWFDQQDSETLTYVVTVLPDDSMENKLALKYKEMERMVNALFPNSKIRLLVVGDKLIVKGQARDIREATNIYDLVKGQYAKLDKTPDTLNTNGNPAAANGNPPGGGGAGLPPGATPGTSMGAPPVANIGAPPVGATGLGTTIQLNANGGGGYGADENDNSNVINMIEVPGEAQIMLKVRIAEVKRSALRQLGVNFAINPTGAIGSFFYNGSFANSTNPAAILNDNSVSSLINALASNNTMKILAEPNLVTISGRPASFLSGGSFPVPTAVGLGGIGAASTFFQGYGTQLFFIPTILDKDRVRLQVTPSMSSLDRTTTVNGIPGLTLSTAFTTVDLRAGQWLAIAGLLVDRQNGQNSRLPLLGEIAGVKLAFSNKTIKREETELIVLVSPVLVHPLEPKQAPALLPGMDITEPDNWDFYVKGRWEGRPDIQYRSTIAPVVKNRIHDSKYGHAVQNSEQFFIQGPGGFSH